MCTYAKDVLIELLKVCQVYREISTFLGISTYDWYCCHVFYTFVVIEWDGILTCIHNQSIM